MLELGRFMKLCLVNGYDSLNKGQQMFHGVNQLGARLSDEGVAIWEEGRRRNHIVYSPENVVGFNESDVLIFIDWKIPGQSNNLYYEFLETDKRPAYLMKREVPFWNPLVPSYDQFRAVFSFEEDSGYDNVYESNYCIDVSQYQYTGGVRDLECSLVSTNYSRDEPGCLYAYRRESARSLSESFGTRFEVYGRGWEGERVNYKGTCDSKADLLSRSVFNLCTENYANVPGYVTEKLLESVFYGSIPIYFCTGHSKNKIPKDVFINCANIDPSDLPQFLKDITIAERNNLRDLGREWLLSEAFQTRFDSRAQAKVFWDTVESSA